MAISLGLRAIAQGYNALFTTVNQMLEELYMSRADNSFMQKLKIYTTPDLLILDELGLKKLNQNSVDDFYEVVSRRYERGSIIVTSNKVFEEWATIFYDPVLASAILDRFVHHCHFVVIKGDSYRMKQSEEALKQMSKLKILHFDEGFWLYYYRLERSKFKWPMTRQEALKVNIDELRWILKGYEVRTASKFKLIEEKNYY